MVNVYPITGKIWYRESTDEWVLELRGQRVHPEPDTRHE